MNIMIYCISLRDVASEGLIDDKFNSVNGLVPFPHCTMMWHKLDRVSLSIILVPL